jgi:O-antigen ligase
MNIGALLVLSMVTYCQKEINLLKKAVVYSGWLTLLLMIFYAQVDIFSGFRLTVVVNGVYQDPNYLIGFVIFPTLYYYYDFLENRKKMSLFKMLIFMVFILLTGSRGGLLAMGSAILLLTLAWIIEKGIKSSAVLKISGVLILLTAAFFVALQVLPQEIVSRFTIASVLESGGSGRTTIWAMAIDAYKDFSIFHKLFGYGAGTITYFTDGIVAHNLWLESLLEIGVIGTLIFIIFYLTYFKKAVDMKDYVVLASFFGYIVMSMSLSLYSFKPIWNIMLLILILKNRQSFCQD